MSIKICVHHFTQRELPENMGKNVRFNVFCWDCVDLTNASGFNGVEQCEKCLSRRNSKVHHTTFIWIALSLCFSSLTVSLCFSPHSFLFMFCFCFEILCFTIKRAVVLQPFLLFLLFQFYTPEKSQHAAIHPLAYLLNWLNLNALKPICLPILTAQQLNVWFNNIAHQGRFEVVDGLH